METYILFLISAVLFGGGAAYVLITQAQELAKNEGHVKIKRLVLIFLKRLVMFAGIVGLRTAYAIAVPKIKATRNYVRSLITIATHKFERRFGHTLNLIAGRATITKGNSSSYLERIHSHKESLQKGAIDYDFSN
jgi:hypothetical protein